MDVCRAINAQCDVAARFPFVWRVVDAAFTTSFTYDVQWDTFSCVQNKWCTNIKALSYYSYIRDSIEEKLISFFKLTQVLRPVSLTNISWK